MPVPVKLVDTPAEWDGAVAVRVAVFVGEQGVPLSAELDEHDRTALHAVAIDEPNDEPNGNVVGTARLIAGPDGAYRFGRLAVLPAWRRNGLGSRLLGFLEEQARRRDARCIVLHAQTHVETFYARHGYAADQPDHQFMEDGIPHIRMTKLLAPLLAPVADA